MVEEVLYCAFSSYKFHSQWVSVIFYNTPSVTFVYVKRKSIHSKINIKKTRVYSEPIWIWYVLVEIYSQNFLCKGGLRWKFICISIDKTNLHNWVQINRRIINCIIQLLPRSRVGLFVLGGFRPTREFFTHMETSPLPVKGCKFWPMLGIHGHWAARIL